MDAWTGLRVLETAEGLAAGALYGQLFAGLDAKVLEVEVTRGNPLRRAATLASNGTSCAFHLINASKESVCLSENQSAASATTAPPAVVGTSRV